MVCRSTAKTVFVNVHFPYRAVICGEKHIVKGWRGRKLITNNGGFFVRHIYGDWQIQAHRLFEVAVIQPDGNGDWLLNGKPLSLLKSLPMGARLADIPGDENLRVYEERICAVAWFQIALLKSVTEFLDKLTNFWKQASQPADEKASLGETVLLGLHEIFEWKSVAGAWSKPVWLTEFRPVARRKLERAELKTIPAQPATAAIGTVKPVKQKAAELHRPKPVARFESDFSVAIIPGNAGNEIALTIEPELQALVKRIVDAGGNLPRTRLRSG